MASTFTTLLRLNKPSLGDAGWGTAVNGGFTDLADSAIAGTTSVDVTLADVTLTSLNGAADQARQMFLVATGTPGVAREVLVPSTSKLYFVKNESDDVVTFKVSGQTGVAVPVGKAMALRVDGTDVVVAQDQFVDLTASGNVSVAGTTTLAALTASGNVSFDGGTFVFNESGADKDARFEGDTDANLLFLDASTDRVGVGTSTPDAKLDVSGPASVTSFTGSTRLGLTVKGSTAVTDYSGIDFSGNSQTVPTARIAVLSDAGGSKLVFGTSNNYATGITNAALLIDASGNVGIGTASPTGQLHLAATNAQQIFKTDQSTSGYTYTQGLDDTGVYFAHNSSSRSIRWAPNSVTQMELDVSGNLYCQGVYANTTGSAANVFVASNGLLQRSTSSLKYKTDVQDAVHGLTEVMRLRPVTYKGKNDGDKVFGGLIAEEVHAVGLTEFVAYNDASEPDALHYGNMVALLTKAIQEQQALIDALTVRIEALEAK